MQTTILKAENLTKVFNQERQGVKVIDHLNLDIYRHDFTVIMGPSGAGKSTLLYALSGMDQITSGKVYYLQGELNQMSEKQMSALRSKDFGFVFQQANLVSHLSLYENILVAAYVNAKRTESSVETRALQLLEDMHLTHAKDRLPHEVSGGEAQRAAVARAIVNHPKIVFADEPTGALNQSNSQEVLDILTRLHDNGQCIVLVTHDISAAARGTRIIYLEDGHLISELKWSQESPVSLQEREKKVSQWLSDLRW